MPTHWKRRGGKDVRKSADDQHQQLGLRGVLGSQRQQHAHEIRRRASQQRGVAGKVGHGRHGQQQPRQVQTGQQIGRRPLEQLEEHEEFCEIGIMTKERKGESEKESRGSKKDKKLVRNERHK